LKMWASQTFLLQKKWGLVFSGISLLNHTFDRR
jgi:hypothetical protein